MSKLLTEIGGQDGVPVLKPVTRRKPPNGYKAPVYGEPTREEVLTLTYDDGADEERIRRAKALAGLAMTKYRFWGITNIVNTIRLWLQARRLRAQANRADR